MGYVDRSDEKTAVLHDSFDGVDGTLPLLYGTNTPPPDVAILVNSRARPRRSVRLSMQEDIGRRRYGRSLENNRLKAIDMWFLTAWSTAHLEMNVQRTLS